MRLILYGLLLGAGVTIPSQAQRPAVLPPDSEFAKVTLASGLIQPIGFQFAPDGRIFIVEKAGKLRIVKPGKAGLTEAGRITTTSTGENGLLDIAFDPEFPVNNWIYFHYLNGKNRISRFTMHGDSLIAGSEKILLEIGNESNGHVGGGLVMGADGHLFIGTGDNTSWQQWLLDGSPQTDALRSSGNSNDLRGKILRIKPLPLPDGASAPSPGPGSTYEIPPGNLFAPGTARTRPEIYAMGFKQPFRFALDAHTGWIYVGDVGPDFDQYGATGYEEINIVKSAGNFGWPQIIGAEPNRYPGNNKFFDPAAPANPSKNNTGLAVLPPARNPWIWYVNHHYTGKDHCQAEFAAVGCENKGSAMAGPFYRYDPAVQSPGKLPSQFHNHFFWWEFQRLRLHGAAPAPDANGVPVVYRFLEQLDFSSQIDMDLGPDHHLYLLTFGANGFTRGVAGLHRIDFKGTDPGVTGLRDFRVPNARPRLLLSGKAAGPQILFPAGAGKRAAVRDASGKLLFERAVGADDILPLQGAVLSGLFILQVDGSGSSQSFLLMGP